MKTIYCSFNYLFIKLNVETNIENGVYSLKEDDLMLYVFDKETTTEEYLVVQKQFMSKFNFEQLDDCYSTQKRYYKTEEAYKARHQHVVNALLKDISEFNLDDYSKVM